MFLQRLLAYNSYANASSLDLSLRLSRIAHSAGIEASIVSCRNLRPKQLERGNFIFIGGVSTNPWVSEIQKSLEFEHLTSRYPSPRRYFVNRRPQPGEPAIFTNTESNPDEHYFTRVALLNNPFGPGKVALLGGTSRDATEAAGQFALSQAGLNEISRRCGKPADRLSGFEVILGTKSVAGHTSPTTSWPAAAARDALAVFVIGEEAVDRGPHLRRHARRQALHLLFR